MDGVKQPGQNGQVYLPAQIFYHLRQIKWVSFKESVMEANKFFVYCQSDRAAMEEYQHKETNSHKIFS